MVLALSPHLDDAVFSVGALLSGLAASREEVVVATIFTASMPEPRGFALACQTDKGFGPEVAYMALRRAEDVEACTSLGATPEHWGFAEAPHRGYESPAELFQGVRDVSSERILVGALAERIGTALRSHRPSDICYPIGAGHHVDHLILIKAVDRIRGAYPDIRWTQWYDQPYVARHADRYDGLASAKTVTTLEEVGEGAVALDWGSIVDDVPPASLVTKWRACAAYASQVDYQFYGALGATRGPGADDGARIAAVLGAREYLISSVDVEAAEA